MVNSVLFIAHRKKSKHLEISSTPKCHGKQKSVASFRTLNKQWRNMEVPVKKHARKCGK